MAVTTWNPNVYLRFAGQRLRPALDLLAQVPLEAPRTVYDLGCGPGTATVFMKRRWPHARVVGVDGSAPMLERARQEHEDIAWEKGDLRTWEPPEPVDLLFSNAALHWLDGHAALFPRLVEMLAPGGVLAVQMPRNFGEPTHTTIFETIRAHPWRSRLEGLLNETPTAPPAFYYGVLRPLVSELDMWETVYMQVMEGENPVVEFTKGSFLRPILDTLNEAEAAEFLREYADRVRPHYPRRADGMTLVPFRRSFLIATR
ncbi:MAG: methyltransferase domain-containing protein [Chloroflexota bacterium]